MTHEEARVHAKQFSQQYMLTKPWSDYINGCSARHTGSTPDTAHLKTDYFIWVGLNAPLPENLVLPDDFDSLPVFTEVIGPIAAQ
jgi:hypothetical protein